jgi:hypothetical protein
MRTRYRSALVGLAALTAGLAGCGGDDEGGSSSPPAGGGFPTARSPTVTLAAPPPSIATAPEAEPPSTSTSPESAPGGGGDEEPARTEVTFTGVRGGVTPRHAGVAPYIAVRITLASKDGSTHMLVIDGKTLAVGGTRKSAFVQLPGLPPGRSYKGVADAGTTIRVVSSSEPGP